MVQQHCSGALSSRLEYDPESPADGSGRGKITLVQGFISRKDSFLNSESYAPLIILAIEEKDNRTELYFQNPDRPQEISIKTANGLQATIKFYPPPPDVDEDGFPDASELQFEDDRQAFLQWFVRIAESQFKKVNYGWNRKERDCSGLIRYAYREALKMHTSDWYNKNGIVIDKNLPDVHKFNYPDLPVIGGKIFKTGQGGPEDLKTFGTFADAETLMKYNTVFISRNLQDARAGDILFFHDRGAAISPYHSVIVSKNDLQGTILLYHTGSEQGIKRVAADYLKGNRSFAPEEWNDRFLGVFRFHIIH